MKRINVLNNKEVFDFLLNNDNIGLVAYHPDFNNSIKKGVGPDAEWHKNYLGKYPCEMHTTQSEQVCSYIEFVVRKADNFIIDNFGDIRGVADTIENESLSFKLNGTKNYYKIHIFYKDVLIESFDNSDLKNPNNTEIKIFKGKNNFVIINSFMLEEAFSKLNHSTEITRTKDDYFGFTVDYLAQYEVEEGALYKLVESHAFNGEDCGSESMGNGVTGTYEIVDNEQVYLIIDDINKILTDRDKFYQRTEEQLEHLNELEAKVNKVLTGIALEKI